MQQTSKNTSMFAIRRKLALTIASAKERVIMVEQYPPNLLLAVGSNLKAQQAKNVHVRAVCAVEPGQKVAEKFKKEDFIEYRRMTQITNLSGIPDETQKLSEKWVSLGFQGYLCYSGCCLSGLFSREL